MSLLEILELYEQARADLTDARRERAANPKDELLQMSVELLQEEIESLKHILTNEALREKEAA
jgi:hypothetical protein